MVSSSLVPRDRPILGLLAATLLLVGFVPEAGVAQDAGRTIYLGNNDVHYVYLKPED